MTRLGARMMTKLESLIAELCPDGVEYMRLNDVCNPISNIKWKNEENKSYSYDFKTKTR